MHSFVLCTILPGLLYLFQHRRPICKSALFVLSAQINTYFYLHFLKSVVGLHTLKSAKAAPAKRVRTFWSKAKAGHTASTAVQAINSRNNCLQLFQFLHF